MSTPFVALFSAVAEERAVAVLMVPPKICKRLRFWVLCLVLAFVCAFLWLQCCRQTATSAAALLAPYVCDSDSDSEIAASVLLEVRAAVAAKGWLSSAAVASFLLLCGSSGSAGRMYPARLLLARS